MDFPADVATVVSTLVTEDLDGAAVIVSVSTDAAIVTDQDRELLETRRVPRRGDARAKRAEDD